MAKAGSIAGKGQGWHKQSVRHSNARLKGRAGGKYASYSKSQLSNLIRSDKAEKLSLKDRKLLYFELEKRIAIDKEKIRYNLDKHYGKKDMTYNQLKKAGIKLSPKGDADGDGKPNSLDCRPLNKNKQDVSKKEELQSAINDINVNDADYKKEVGQRLAEATEKREITREEAIDLWKNYHSYKPEEAFKEEKPKTHKIRDAFEKGSEWVKEQGEKAKEARREKRERQVDRIEKELETDDELDEEDKTRIEDLDVSELTDKELKTLAIREGESFWGGNQYEEEILRRIKTEAKIETEKRIAINEAKKEAQETLKEEKPKGENFFEWITK